MHCLDGKNVSLKITLFPNNMKLPFCCKCLENWTKFQKQLFLGTQKYAKYNHNDIIYPLAWLKLETANTNVSREVE